MSGQINSAIMQSYKKRKKWLDTEKAKKCPAIMLFLEEEFDYSPLTRRKHAGYLHLLQIHFKRLKMETEQLPEVNRRVYVKELYEFIIFDITTKNHLINTIEEFGIVQAATEVEKQLEHDHYLVSISLAPLKTKTID